MQILSFSYLCDPEESQKRELILFWLVFTFLLYTQAFEHQGFQSHSQACLQLFRVQNKNKQNQQTDQTNRNLPLKREPSTRWQMFSLSSGRKLQLISTLYATDDTVENLHYFHITLITMWLAKASKTFMFSH